MIKGFATRRFAEFLFIALCFWFAPAHAENLSGHPRVVDADTLAFGAERVRIEGIDAPEMRQNCRDSEGRGYPCGKAATAALRARIASQSVTCEGSERDKYGRLLGYCFFADGSDLNRWIVRQGHAQAHRKYSKRYIGAEDAAKAERLGIWVGEFVPPWDCATGKTALMADRS